MKIQSKSPFLNFSDTISLLNPNKLIKVKEMNKWEEESIARAKSKISEYPTFHKAPIVQVLDNLETLRQVIENGTARMKQKLIDDAIKYGVSYEEENPNWLRLYGETTRRKNLCAKAVRYKINYVDWDRLEEQVEEWEGLLREARELKLKVDPSDYDPWGLRNRIEEEISQSKKEMRDQRLDYYCAR